jgi:hypothetical protein
MRAIFLLLVCVSTLSTSIAAPSSLSAAIFHLDCDSGSDAEEGRGAGTPVRTVARAQALVRALRAHDATAALPPRPVTVFMRGTCGPARFTAADGGVGEASRVAYVAAPGARAPPALSGGVAVPASWLSPVTDAETLAQLPTDAARAAVRQLDLGAHGAAIPDAGTLNCKPYMGGEGERRAHPKNHDRNKP